MKKEKTIQKFLRQIAHASPCQVVFRVRDFLLEILFPKSAQSLRLDTIDPAVFRTAHLRTNPWLSENTLAFFEYRNEAVKELVWQMKFSKSNNSIRAAEILAEAVSLPLMEELAEKFINSPLLIPIPLSKERLKERGFSQTERLAKLLAEHCPLFELSTDTLLKISDTPHQTKLENKAERLKNLSGSFELQNPEKIRNRIILLLDDVTTTGTTLEEATKILQIAEPRRIIRVALAH